MILSEGVHGGILIHVLLILPARLTAPVASTQQISYELSEIFTNDVYVFWGFSEGSNSESNCACVVRATYHLNAPELRTSNRMTFTFACSIPLELKWQSFAATNMAMNCGPNSNQTLLKFARLFWRFENQNLEPLLVKYYTAPQSFCGIPFISKLLRI